jgi:tripartite-type tricarboxylate transporter receptor subunit TctC
MGLTSLAAFGSGCALVAAVCASASAAPAPTYKGKTLTLYIGYSAGGGYDVYGREVARFIGKHLPGNPTVVPENMEGAGSLRLANYLANVAPKDGTAIGIISNGTAFDPILGQPGAAFKGTDFFWLGSANNEVSVCVTMASSPIKTIADAIAHQVTVGATGGSDDTAQFPRVLDGTIGTKFKVVTGYPGGNDVVVAMERGEVEGRCGWSWSSVMSTKGDWVKTGKLNVLVQTALTKHKDLPNVPLVTDLAKTPEQKEILTMIFARQTMGRPFLAPPGLDPAYGALLRKAFADTLTDPDFLAEAKKINLEVNPVSGEDITALVQKIYATPPAVAHEAAALLQP